MVLKTKMNAHTSIQWRLVPNILDNPQILSHWSDTIAKHGDPFIPKDATLQFEGIGGSFPETDRSVTIKCSDDTISLVGLGSSDGHEFYTDDELRLLAVLLIKSIASVKGLDPTQATII
jgi:hypothetical protein